MAMDNRSAPPPEKSPLTKSFVVICSIVLVGGYILFRSGGSLFLLPSSKSARVAPISVDDESSTPAPSESADSPRVMPGSKSAAVLDSRDIARAQPAPSHAPPSQAPPGTQP